MISADAAPTRGQVFFHTFGSQPFATDATALGGGATLPVPAYLGRSVNGSYEASGSTTFGVAGSILGYFGSQAGGLNIEYCATGSGKGKDVFEKVMGSNVQVPCSNAASGSTATTFGFEPPSGTPRPALPAITGTDAPLSQTDYTAYITAFAAPAEPVELPSVYGAIAIIYHDNALGSSGKRITLTNAQICGVYNGTYTTFGKLLGTSDTTPIVPVYRADGSGTSFNFSNHLATACAGYGANQSFVMADPKLPATSLGETGNSGVIATVNSTNGAIGYAEAGYLVDLPNGTGPTNYADVKNPTTGVAADPFMGLPSAANTVSSSSLLTNVVVNQTTSGPATTSPLVVRSGSCVKVIPPAAFANPKTGYPIVAVTYLLTNSRGNGSADTALRLLEKDLTTPSLFKHPSGSAPITTVDEAEPAVTSGTTGYSSLGSTFATPIQSTANVCINV